MTHRRAQDLRIRRAEPSDADAISRMHFRSWKVGYRGVVPDAVLDGLSLERYRTMWQDILRQPDGPRRTFVAELRGKIIGYCSIGSSRLPEEREATAEIWGLYVDPNWFRNGIGSALIDRAIDELSDMGYEQVALWVLSDNYQGRAFYEAMGWRVTQRTNNLPIGEETRYIRPLPWRPPLGGT